MPWFEKVERPGGSNLQKQPDSLPPNVLSHIIKQRPTEYIWGHLAILSFSIQTGAGAQGPVKATALLQPNELSNAIQFHLKQNLRWIWDPHTQIKHLQGVVREIKNGFPLANVPRRGFLQLCTFPPSLHCLYTWNLLWPSDPETNLLSKVKRALDSWFNSRLCSQG